MKAVVVATDMITAHGRGIDAAWRDLLAGRSALAHSDRIRFPSGNDKTPLGLVPCVVPGTPAVLQMLEPILRDLRPQIPADTLILLATTTGEIESLESATTNPGTDSGETSDPSFLLAKVCALCGTNRGGLVISAACASSTVAVARAAALIRSGAENSVLVVGCDPVSEFVYAGFATMNALDATEAKPFDQNRQGLNLGEAAAVALLMSESRAQSEDRASLGSIAGWAVSNDATHVTRPDKTGEQLARASALAMERSAVAPHQLAFISAHGTGTRYNDAMEMAAFKSVLPPLPVFSIKGALGHTLGAAGLLEIVLSLRALAEGVVPPTPGLEQPDECTRWEAGETSVSNTKGGSRIPQSTRAALATNSGFGGINAALILTAPDYQGPSPQSGPAIKNVGAASGGIGWITSSAYGRVRRGEVCSYAGRTTARLVGSVDALFQHKIESFGRFDPVSRMTCYACALALHDAGIEYSPENKQPLGILGVGFTGSLAANRAYFKDYVDSGRILARGNLFVYTLPSAPVGEAAIHFGFHGPLFATIALDTPFAQGLEMARSLVNDGDAPAMLVVQAEADCALAAVVGPDFDQTLSRLSELSARFPRLSQLIPAISQQEEYQPCK